MSEVPQENNRQITISRDVIGSAIVSGNGNKVFIYHYQLDRPARVEAEPSTPHLSPNPYRGLSAFQVEDADVYFGREAEVERLWNRLRGFQERTTQGNPPVRLLPILGASGSGKSSLARAGLLPELARRPLPGYRQPRVVVMTPSSLPLQSLAVVLARIATGDPTPAEKTAEFERVLGNLNDQGQRDGLRRIANALPNIEQSPLVVLIDQFEEVYSLCKDTNERSIFIDNLIEAASSPEARVSVVITLRLDFVGETQRHPLLNQIIGSDQSAILPVMTPQELYRAIAEPAKQAGQPLDEGVVDRLIEDTEGREGALPLLQFALTEIWEGLVQGKSAIETLTAIGGVGGALAGKAQFIYDGLNDTEKDIARRIFVGLVELGEGTQDTRRRATVESLTSDQDNPALVREVIGRFSDYRARLLTLSRVEGKEASVEGQEVAEVTHEALLDHWQQIKEWLDGQRPLIWQQRRINTLAEEWKSHSKKSGYLLQGRQLDDAHSFQKRHAKSLPLTENAAEFVRKSLRQRWLWRAAIASFLILPAIVIDSFLREAAVTEHYKTLKGEDISGKPEAAQALVRGCRHLQSLPDWFSPVGERVFGTCRTLEGANLTKTDLSNAKLFNANLSFADLSGAKLFNAKLSDADLSGAKLFNADLSNAKLFNAKLIGADLSGAKLFNAKLSDADLSLAKLSNADLSLAKLSNVNLSVADLSNADLSSADLSSADLRDAFLAGVNLSDTDLSNTRSLTQEQLNGAGLCETELPPNIKINPDRDCEALEIDP